MQKQPFITSLESKKYLKELSDKLADASEQYLQSRCVTALSQVSTDLRSVSETMRADAAKMRQQSRLAREQIAQRFGRL